MGAKGAPKVKHEPTYQHMANTRTTHETHERHDQHMHTHDNTKKRGSPNDNPKTHENIKKHMANTRANTKHTHTRTHKAPYDNKNLKHMKTNKNT